MLFSKQNMQHSFAELMSQVLIAFLEADEPLLSSFQWLQLTPPQHSFLEGVARLPRQLLGTACCFDKCNKRLLDLRVLCCLGLTSWGQLHK